MTAPHATQCPTESLLSDFGLGKLDAADFVRSRGLASVYGQNSYEFCYTDGRALSGGGAQCMLTREAYIRYSGRRLRVAAKRRNSIAQGAAQRSPGLADRQSILALKGRNSGRRHDARNGKRPAPGNYALSGLRRFVATRTQGFTLGCGLTHLRCYEDLSVETDQ